jgi:hypothetical protein
MARCDTRSAARSAQRGNMRRPRHGPKEGVLQMLRTVAKAGQPCDLKMLREIQKCPDSSKATSILADALAHSAHMDGRDNRICPDASWVHPLV